MQTLEIKVKYLMTTAVGRNAKLTFSTGKIRCKTKSRELCFKGGGAVSPGAAALASITTGNSFS